MKNVSKYRNKYLIASWGVAMQALFQVKPRRLILIIIIIIIITIIIIIIIIIIIVTLIMMMTYISFDIFLWHEFNT